MYNTTDSWFSIKFYQYSVSVFKIIWLHSEVIKLRQIMHQWMYILNKGSGKLMYDKILREIRQLDKKKIWELRIMYALYYIYLVFNKMKMRLLHLKRPFIFQPHVKKEHGPFHSESCSKVSILQRERTFS